MEWTDEGIVLSARPHGETATIVTLLTPEHGRHAGMVPGGQGRRMQSVLQPGNHVQAVWRARLLDHLGIYSMDVVTAYAAPWLDSQEILSILASACVMTEAALPERQAMPGVYAGLMALFSQPNADLWGPLYIKWEMGLLRALGYGLDLTQCAISGAMDNLSHVSPRTGRAVTSMAAKPYKDRLLTLPAFLTGAAEWDVRDICQGLELTGHFLTRHVFANPHGRTLTTQAGDLPPARMRLMEYYRRVVEQGANLGAEHVA